MLETGFVRQPKKSISVRIESLCSEPRNPSRANQGNINNRLGNILSFCSKLLGVCQKRVHFSADMLGSFVALLALLALSSVSTGIEDYLFENQMKLVYCDQIKTQAVYRNEDLAENCVIKVNIFYGKVTRDY